MKKELRKKFKSLRHHSFATDEAVCNNLLKLVIEYSNIALYMGINEEIKLDSLINKLLLNKNLYFPYVIKGKDLEFRKLEKIEAVTSDTAGIPTPNSNITLPTNMLDIVVMPCICASTLGYRLGYGGGYYDKTLANYKGIKAGVTYEACLTDIDFSESFDIKLDYIVTEDKIIKIEKM